MSDCNNGLQHYNVYTERVSDCSDGLQHYNVYTERVSDCSNGLRHYIVDYIVMLTTYADI